MKALVVFLITVLTSVASARPSLEEAKSNGMQETLQSYIEGAGNIVDICVYEQRWIPAKKEFPKGRIVRRAVVTHVYAGTVPIGTKLEFEHLIEDPPKLFQDFTATVEGELRTFFFDDADVVKREDRLVIDGDGHWSFQRVGDAFADLFQLELKTNAKFRPGSP